MVPVQSREVQVGIVSVGTWDWATKVDRPSVWFTSVEGKMTNMIKLSNSAKK